MPNAIRIAQVVEAVEGGCKKHVLDLVSGLDPTRFRQTVIHSSRRDPGFPEAVAAATGGAVETIPWNILRRFCPVLDVQGHGFLRRLFRERGFDIIHCHSAKAGLLGRLAARHLPAAKVYTPHCFPFCMETGAFATVLYLWLERLAGRSTDRLVAVAPAEADIARAMNVVAPKRVVLIENGIDPRPFDVTVDVEAKRAELGLAMTDEVVLCVGALRPQKGHRYLIEAIPEIIRSRPQVRVLIAGVGREEDDLLELVGRLGVGKHVRLLGARDDVPELLKIADCLVMPSLWEAGPYVVLEAMAAGTPVVASRILGLTDWVREGHTGRLAEPKNPSSLANAIQQTLSQPEESRRMAAEAKDMVLRRNMRDRWLSDMAALYELLASARKPSHP
ncbi:MAG: glycosyltransferase family 4 protein [Armatimonadetes bacterium]|nr:glycosyltransferase family 4 protein [Armatimonadota bacterium]